MTKVVCGICPHRCEIPGGGIGFCMARGNVDGTVTAINYAKVTSIALDPIEKKPLYRFYPGSHILSVGSFGCNLRCPFCQNFEISMADEKIPSRTIVPEELMEIAVSLKKQGNIGIAYTYNEPLIGYEYVRDCAEAAHRLNLKNVLVTNGYVCEQPLRELMPYIDAMNIDLKSFSQDFYRSIAGDLETVKRTIAIAYEQCHVEVTTLVIPGRNDGDDEMRSLSQWLKSIDAGIPLHLSRFFPRYHLLSEPATPISTLNRLAAIARESLRYVYLGNC